jgi:hypothetical protein
MLSLLASDLHPLVGSQRRIPRADRPPGWCVFRPADEVTDDPGCLRAPTLHGGSHALEPIAFAVRPPIHLRT